MGIVFLSGVVLSIILSLWQFTYCLSGFNRTYEGIDVTMMQNAVSFDYSDSMGATLSGQSPYFNVYLTKKIINDYIDENLPNFTIGGTYSVTITFSDYQTYFGNLGFFPKNVKVALSYASPVYSANRNKNFRISKGAAYEA